MATNLTMAKVKQGDSFQWRGWQCLVWLVVALWVGGGDDDKGGEETNTKKVVERRRESQSHISHKSNVIFNGYMDLVFKKSMPRRIWHSCQLQF